MHDFTVKVTEDQVAELHGHLVDTTNFELVRDLLTSSRGIAFDKIYSVTWIGIQRLLDFLDQQQKPYSFTRVPIDLFTVLSVFPKFTNFTISNIIIVPVDNRKASGTGAAEDVQRTVTLSIDELRQIAEQQGILGTLNDGRLVPGITTHYLRYLSSAKLAQIKQNFPSLWCRANNEECLFWLDYFAFCTRIIHTCILTTHATGVLIEESLQKITMKATACEAAIKVIEKDYAGRKARELFKILPFVRKLASEAESYLNVAWNGFKEFSNGFLNCLNDPTFSQNRFNEQLRSFVELGQHLQPVTQNIERLGSSLGERVLGFSNISSVGDFFSKVQSEGLSESDIKTVRRKLGLEEVGIISWMDSLREIKEMIKTINEDIERCIVALQGFDLVRQVLEHRLSEVSILADELHSAGFSQKLDWKEARQKILQAAFNKLVTDQEKLVFRFFFDDFESEEEYKKQMSAQQGEIMLF